MNVRLGWPGFSFGGLFVDWDKILKKMSPKWIVRVLVGVARMLCSSSSRWATSSIFSWKAAMGNGFFRFKFKETCGGKFAVSGVAFFLGTLLHSFGKGKPVFFALSIASAMTYPLVSSRPYIYGICNNHHKEKSSHGLAWRTESTTVAWFVLFPARFGNHGAHWKKKKGSSSSL